MLSSLVLDKTCQVLVDTILFIERINKIEDKRSTLHKAVFSMVSLLVAYGYVKSRSSNMTLDQGKEMLKGIKDVVY